LDSKRIGKKRSGKKKFRLQDSKQFGACVEYYEEMAKTVLPFECNSSRIWRAWID